MTKFRRIFYLFLACIILYSCSTVPNELKTAEQLIETAPDSALQMLRNLPPHKYKYAKNRALYGLLMIQALDKKILPLKPDSLLDFSLAYYQEHTDKNRLIACYLYKGRSYKYASQYENAMNYYLKALDESQNCKNNTLKGRIYYDLGDIYTIQRDYPKARQKFKIAYTYFKKDNFQLLAFYSLLSIGRSFHESKDYKIAAKYYRKIFNYAKDSLQKGSLFQEMGLNFHDSGKMDSALIYFRKAIYLPYVNNNRAIRYCYMSNLFFNLNQIDSAFIYSKKSFNYETDIRTQRECYRIMTNCELLKGSTKDITIYMNKYVVLSDSIRKIDAQTKGSYIESKHNTELKYTKTLSKLWYSLGLTILVIALSYLLYRTQRVRTKKEKISLHETFSQQKADIRKNVVIKYRETLKQKIENQKMHHAKEKKNANYTEKIFIDREIYEELLHLNKPEIFFHEMDTILNNLPTKLRNRYPSITVKEISWCCLLLLDISPADIYFLLDYTVDGLKSMRKRLTQKVGITGVSKLKDFLEELLYE